MASEEEPIYQDPHVLALNEVVLMHKKKMEGCLLYSGIKKDDEGNYNFLKVPAWRAKRDNLLILAERSKSMIEIGFNAGHACALALSANPTIQIVSFDICRHRYTLPCFEKLRASFPSIELIQGDSTETMRQYVEENPNLRFDVIHVDGSHKLEDFIEDVENSKDMSSENTFLVVDDATWSEIRNQLSKWIDENYLLEVNYEQNGLLQTKHHRIFHFSMI